jgi:hypothetical protein
MTPLDKLHRVIKGEASPQEMRDDELLRVLGQSQKWGAGGWLNLTPAQRRVMIHLLRRDQILRYVPWDRNLASAIARVLRPPT